MPAKDEHGRVIRVIERQRIPLPLGLDTHRIRERFVAAVAAAGMPDALEVRGRSLFAKDAVGVVDIGEIAVEILPKTRDASDTVEGRRFLVDLLRFAGRDRGPFATAAANISEGQGGLIELLFAWAIRTAASHADMGLPRRYVVRTDTSTAVRGRIDMKRVALARPGRDFELVIRHAPLSPDNDIGRGLRWLAGEISARTRRSETRRISSALCAQLEHIGKVDADVALFDRIMLRPLEDHWGPILGFARSLARQRSLDPASAGAHPSIAVLFTLHDLFERCLRRVFAEQGPAVGLLPGRIPSHLLNSLGGGSLVRLRPDHAFRLSTLTGDRLGVGDAKWKEMWTPAGTPDPRREDAYQLAAYMVAGRSHAGFIFAPLWGGADGAALRVFQNTMTGLNRRVDVIGIHMPTLLRGDKSGAELRLRLCKAVVSGVAFVPDGQSEVATM